MKKHFTLYAIFSAVLILLCGCVSDETLTVADITIGELESKMEQAMDPDGAFRKANSYVQREMLKVEGLFADSIYQIDLKYKKPHFFKLTTLEKNEPVSAVIFNAGSAWKVDYVGKHVHEITGSDLVRINVLHKLTTPTEKYSKLFDNITVYNCTIKDDNTQYYKIVCNPQNKENTISIYVNAEDFLPRRINADLSLVIESKKVEFEYDSFIDAYETMDNVVIPQKSTAVSSGIESTTTVFDYKLNVDIPDSEFLPPVFTENKLRDRMDRFYNKKKNNRGFDRKRNFKD